MSSPPDRGPVLIAALSGRALAAAARRSGYRPLVADLFGDLDTQEMAEASICLPGSLKRGFVPGALGDALARLSAGRTPVGLVYGSGFEDRSGLLGRLARHHHLLGNPPQVVRAVKDPSRFAAACAKAEVPHPPIAAQVGTGTWLEKRTGGSGGVHVRPARGAPGSRSYLQRHVAGEPVSALFLADGARIQVLGFSAQWTDPAPDQPFRYGGAVRPALLSPAQEVAMRSAIAHLAAGFALRGLNTADFLARDDGFDLLEINPRPGASLDVFASPNLFHQHVAACRGELQDQVPLFAGASAAAVVYAPRRLIVPDRFIWPEWAADRQASHIPVPAGAPLCTVLAEADSSAAARSLAMARRRDILRRIGARHV